MGTERTRRGCTACDTVDELPRHIVGAVNLSWNQPSLQPLYHWECHANLGCAACISMLERSEGRTGDELMNWLDRQRAVHDG